MICADELGPVIPRSFPTRTRLDARRPPGQSSELDYSREPEQSWVYGPLRVGQEAAMTVLLRNSAGYQQPLTTVAFRNVASPCVVMSLSGHK